MKKLYLKKLIICFLVFGKSSNLLSEKVQIPLITGFLEITKEKFQKVHDNFSDKNNERFADMDDWFENHPIGQKYKDKFEKVPGSLKDEWRAKETFSPNPDVTIDKGDIICLAKDPADDDYDPYPWFSLCPGNWKHWLDMVFGGLLFYFFFRVICALGVW